MQALRQLIYFRPCISSILLRPLEVFSKSLPAEKNTCKYNGMNLFYAAYRTKPRERYDQGTNESKARLIIGMNFKNPEDAAPFYNMSVISLLKIFKVRKHDVKTGFCENRLYYIANRLKYPPAVLSKHLVKRSFVYTLSADWLESSLNVLIEMGVPTDRIIRDLWVLKYHKDKIRERLQRVKDMGVDNLYPWMVRCKEDILNRSIKISQDTKSILGDTETTQEYLANRLNVPVETVEEMCVKIPALKTIRVTKLKSFLDFLIDEGYNIKEIADKVRVLTSSQKTVRQRLEKLRELGVDNINLNVVCRSRKDFKRYCDVIVASKESHNL